MKEKKFSNFMSTFSFDVNCVCNKSRPVGGVGIEAAWRRSQMSYGVLSGSEEVATKRPADLMGWRNVGIGSLL